jgi:hypothetical protein
MVVLSRDSLRANFKKHRIFIVVLLLASILWTWVFVHAAIDFLTSTRWPRAVWNGFGSIDLFGFSIRFAFEGWADHDYFYHSWANLPYFFPPFFVYLCVIGKLLQTDLGIGFIISLFGFLTAFPIYGISVYLSGNRHVGAIAAGTYLFNPITLYHTAFEWLNPAPFVFFSVLSFYLLMHNRRILGALAMTTSALFKQTAFFFALPLLAFLLKRAPQPISEDGFDSSEGEEAKKPDGDRLDLRGFMRIVLVVCAYAAVSSMPYLLDPLNYVRAIFSTAGGTYLTDLTSPPPIYYPITLVVLFIILGFPEWLLEPINLFTYYSVGLFIAIIPILVFMLKEVKDDRNLQAYWRRMLFLTLLLMLCVHIFSPRGIYKYYTVALVPFFSILSTSSMCQRSSERVSVSLPMLLVPMICGFAIMVPPRTVYMLYLLLILAGYILHRSFSQTYEILAEPARQLGRRMIAFARQRPVTQ